MLYIYKIDIISNRIFYGIFFGIFFWGILGSLVVQYFDVAIGMIHGFTFNHLIPIALVTSSKVNGQVFSLERATTGYQSFPVVFLV